MSVSAFDDDKPPRPGRGLLKRAALGAALIFVFSAATVASAVILEVEELASIVKEETAPITGIEGALDNVDAGKPQTILLLGSDRRFIDIKQDNPTRSDTMILVRLDPDQEAMAVLSIPRDLKVRIPGRGTDKINAAYSYGGPALSVKTVRQLLDIPIHHVVNVHFGGFQRAVNRLGCMYIDVDRRYFNDNRPPNGGGPGYATIDVPAGYQRMCGQDSLDYVRYRHFDNDFVRAARQQDFLRQAKDQIGLGKIFGDRKELLRIFGRYTQTDIAKKNTGAILRLIRLAFESSRNPIREVRFRGDAGPAYVTITEENIARTRREFLATKASAAPREAGRSAETSSARRERAARRRSPGLPRGVINARRQGEDLVAEASTKLPFPLYYPRAKLARGVYVDKPRVYDLYDRRRTKFRAYRIVVSHGVDGQYYGVQGTNWKAPPILDNPSGKMRMRGRTYELFRDGNRLRLVAWRTPRAVYWVSNTLSQLLTTKQMLAIARSLSRVGDR